MFILSSAAPGFNGISEHERLTLLEVLSGRGKPDMLHAFILPGDLDLGRAEQALHMLALRHEALRTRFVRNAEGEFVRQIERESELTLELHDFSYQLPNGGEIRQFVQWIYERGFTHKDYPLIRTYCLKTIHHSVFVLHVSQIIADATSLSILLRELDALYLDPDGLSRLRPLPFQLTDFAFSEQQWRQSPERAELMEEVTQRLYRAIELRGGHEQLFFARQREDTYLRAHRFDMPLQQKLESIAQASRISVSTIVSMISVAAVARERAWDSTFFTMSCANRGVPGSTNLIAFMATTVPVFMDFQPGTDMQQWVMNMNREIFTCSLRYGMLSIADVSSAVAALYPEKPAEKNFKFGRITLDLQTMKDSLVFGLPAMSYWLTQPKYEVNEFKFVYRFFASGNTELMLRGLREDVNDIQACRVLEQHIPALVDTLHATYC